MKQLSISLVELPATVNGGLNGPLSDDVYALVRLPSRAIDLLAAIAKDGGFGDVETINPNYNEVRGRITLSEWRRLVTSDVVAISSITRTTPQSFELIDRIRKYNPNATIIIGGPHVSALPLEALDYADIVVLNEGDATFVEILNATSNETDLREIKGIVYKDASGEIINTGKRPFLTGDELSRLPFPVYSDQVLKGITHTVIITSRGCPFDCDYCSVIENFGRAFRFVNTERTIELIEHTLKQSRKPIFFGDDNFTASPTRTKELLEEILKRGIKMPYWLTQVRVESANDFELLKLMKRAGCDRVCIGFESVNEATLKLWNKQSNVEKNTFAIKQFHKAGISIHGMFIVGADTDTKETIRETAEYAKKNRIDTAQFTLMVPLPGTKLTKQLEKDQRVISHDWHHYDGHHVLVQPTCMLAHELHEVANEAWLSFYSIKEAVKHLIMGNEHWFNFMVRIWGKKLAKKFIKEGSYYKRSLANLEGWRSQVINEYDSWVAKCDAIANDAKKSFEDRQKLARIELENVLKKISDKKDALDGYFEPYKEKFLYELEKMMLKRLGNMVPA